MPHEAEPVAAPANRSGTPIGSALAILRCFTPGAPLLGVTAIAARVGAHKSSVSRTLATLEGEGLVERDAHSGKYRLGLGLLQLSAALLADLDVRRVARPVLARLSERLGETSSLVLWTGERAVSVEHVPAARPIRHEAQLGTSYGTTASSSVRVLLAGLPAERARRLLADGVIRAERTPEEELARLAAERERGVAINEGSTSPDEVGVSAPVVDRSGETVAAVLVAAPRYRVDEAGLAGIAAAVREAAGEVSTRLAGA
ncbi:MAG: IclR family transcriptional regulator [Pseudoclavibacter sp.]|nr:IclR family transcriptional regulator [Pseudoclavibacter sp.]